AATSDNGTQFTSTWTTTDGNGKEITQSGVVSENDSATTTLMTFPPENTNESGTQFTTSWTTTDGNGNEVTQSGI
ncbi:hypothetical protein G210_2061, partial [Candida maltosa Xu316]